MCLSEDGDDGGVSRPKSTALGPPVAFEIYSGQAKCFVDLDFGSVRHRWSDIYNLLDEQRAVPAETIMKCLRETYVDEFRHYRQ